MANHKFETWTYDISKIAVNKAKQAGIKATLKWSEIPHKTIDAYIVCVSTSLDSCLKSGMSAVINVCRKIKHSKKGKVLVSLESTLAIGTCRKIYADLFNHSVNLVHVARAHGGDCLQYSEEKEMEKIGFKDLVGQIISKNLCVGCGTCAGVCPNTVLTIRETTAGFYVPVIQESKTCVSCGICFENCPARHMPFTLTTDQPGRLVTDETSRLLGAAGGAYIAHAEDKETRAKGSSGGIVSALLIYALQNGLINGAITVGMSKEKPWKPEIRIAKTKKEILEAAGSKYSIMPLNSIFQQVRKIDGRIALVGLPCHIRGLGMIQEHQMEAISRKIAFTIGLFCGLNFRSIATTFLLRKMKIRNMAEIEKLEYRHGYPGGFFVKLPEKELYDTKAGAFLNLFRAQPCTLCDDLTNETADISVGDIYSMHSKEPIGVVLARTRKGEELLLGAKSQGQLDLCRVTEAMVIKSQLTGLLYKKRGSLVRKHILNGKLCAPSSSRNCTSKGFPSSKQLMFELLQREVFFGRLNASLIMVFEHLPLWLASFAYGKLLTFMFMLGKFVYGQS